MIEGRLEKPNNLYVRQSLAPASKIKPTSPVNPKSAIQRFKI